MKGYIFLLVLCIKTLVVFHAGAQEYAMDFVQTDCKGVEHHLYSELDAGKVIVLDFVMLGCAPCIWATKDMDTIVSSYASAHPGRVSIYAFSYENTHTCEQMFEWRATGGFSDVTLFTQGAEMVTYYGGMGMPTIVVTGSSMHKVFYNGFGYSSAQDSMIIAAIDAALVYDQSGLDDGTSPDEFKIYPTLFSDRIFIETGKEFHGSELILCDINGRKVMSKAIRANSRVSIPTSELSKGIYFARYKTGNRLSGSIKLIRH
jgi:thiol-disulfide isomerase/thioredoxin